MAWRKITTAVFPYYVSTIMIGGTFGASQGLYRSFDDIHHRENTKLSPGLTQFEPVLNCVINTSIAFKYVLTGAAASAAVVATAPVSVPLLLKFQDKTNE